MCIEKIVNTIARLFKRPSLWEGLGVGFFFLLSACSPRDRQAVDKLNSLSYAYHYRSLDSTEHYAQQAMLQAAPLGGGRLAALAYYADGQAEALNNLAFVSLMRMDYERAGRLLDSVAQITDNQLELLVSYVQQMRRCQRMSRNRDFYDYREQALRSLQRLHEDPTVLDERQHRRLLYAETEMAIVTSTYYYYVGLERQSVEAMQAVPAGVEQDTAQFLNYLYNVGAGGIVTTGTQQAVSQTEFDHLMRCFLLARQTGCAYFAANSLEALADHLTDGESRQRLIADNLPAMKFLNPGGVSDEQLPLSLAEEALDIFRSYGDTYQIAGAYRTLASCCLEQGNYERALFNLEQALSDTLIRQAPDLVASICEQLSVAYAAIDDKLQSDSNRNLYLDLQEQTRQDRQLEARAGQLEHALGQLNVLLWAVGIAVMVLVLVLVFFYRRMRHSLREKPDDTFQERLEELNEQLAVTRRRVENNERRHLEQRAKVSLVNGITPLIDRMLYAIDRLPSMANGQLEYIQELTDEINLQNQVLTHWIQLRQGELSLHIETFALQDLFDLLKKSQRGFAMKGVHFTVEPTEVRVKADKVLTLFMLNTLADNARKFTDKGGSVRISAAEGDGYVEVSVADTGQGMDEEQLSHVFSHQIAAGHGFGLLNCKGIIEKYRKMSTIFSVCLLSAESRVGEGSRFFFRLPRGMAKMAVVTFMGLLSAMSAQGEGLTLRSADMSEPPHFLHQASIYADSAYFSNINGTYARTLAFADSCRHCLNQYYRQHHKTATDTLLAIDDMAATIAEIAWLYDSVETNYNIILDIRNESAVAALALHEWQLYHYNNRIYTRLLKELSADATLGDYCRKMQQSQTNRQVAVILLVLLFASIVAAVAWQYMLTVNRSARRLKDQQDQLEMMGDELQRLTQEENTLYVSNAVLDNTLSTLKHETMYYPSRIRQLVDQDDRASLSEVAAYYRELYGLLGQQSMRQVEQTKLHLRPLEHGILGDANLIGYMLDILRRQNGQNPLDISYERKGAKYVECRVRMPELRRTDLFTPSTVDNIPYLLCRQIVRDHGEATNRRGCAIAAEVGHDGSTIISITLPSSDSKPTNNSAAE